MESVHDLGRPVRRLRDRRAVRWAWNALIVLGVYLAIRTYQTWGAASGDAPALQGTLLDGSTTSLEELRSRGPVLVHFWATWCGVCRAEEHNLEALVGDHPMITVATRSGSAAQVERYVRDGDVRLPVLVDESGRLAAAYGVTAFPTSFVVDPEGHIRHVEVGYTTELGLRARLFLAGL